MQKRDMIIEKNVPCKLSDGIVLRSDVYRPDDDGVYPVLMLRLPYDKETPRYYDEYLEVPRMVEAGYAVILQDVRGRFASDGTFSPFTDEGKDGCEAVEWAARLPYADGNVGLFGMSYHGYTQLAAAAEKPPSLKAIAPVMTMADPWADLYAEDNAAHATGKFETWVLGSIVEDQLRRKGILDEQKLRYYHENLATFLHQAPAEAWGPMQDLDPDSFFFDVMKGNFPAKVMERANIQDKLHSIDIPALFMGGWFDALLKPTLEAYRAYHGPSMLWIGPWTHEEMTGRAGEVLFQNAEKHIGVDRIQDPTQLHIIWFDYWLKGKPMPVQEPVHLYAMGDAEWKAFSQEPDASKQAFFLQSDGNAATGDSGKLAGQLTETETKTAMVLDPAHPVPTFGGNALIAGSDSGMFDISGVQNRSDVLVYTSDPAEESLLLMGTVKALVWGTSPSALFDIVIRLSDVDEEGRAWNITETFHREKVEPDQIVRLELDVGTTLYRLEAGHRLRIDLAASNAPHYDVNLNNGTTTKTHQDGYSDIEYIHEGGQTGSRILLPIADETDSPL
ncbi:CocE/NonD family hydrolase [Barrientosiimonas marina]|uniref:CocE/NonD family hydrolase n=1 Tax=Lentibacillus kimchii TaxID=1542911 RepID=A0ABW2UTC9_9BACI